MILAKVKSEKGSAFILALMVVAAVGLLVTPVIYLATTGLRSTNLAQQRFAERYAADAGVEEGIWHAQYDPLYVPVPDVWETFDATFNNQQTTVEIMPAGVPTSMYPPTPIPLETSGSASNVLPDTIVDPNTFAPYSGAETVTYVFYLHNFGTSNEVVTGFGVCLPVGFSYAGMVEDPYINSFGLGMPGGIQYLYWNSSGDPFILDDPNPLQAALAVPTVMLNDAAPSCVDPLGVDGRYQVRWDFPPGGGGPGRISLPGNSIGSLTFLATADLGEPALHYNNAWIESTNTSVAVEQLSPVVVKWGQFDIRSSAGGTTVESRITLNGDTNVTNIDSWQVE